MDPTEFIALGAVLYASITALIIMASLAVLRFDDPIARVEGDLDDTDEWIGWGGQR